MRRWSLLTLVCLVVSPSFAQEKLPTGDSTILSSSARVERLWNEGEFTEGVAVAPDGHVFFSDIAIASTNPGRIMRFDPKTKETTVFVADSGQSNGLFFTPNGKLIAACGANRGFRGLYEVTPEGKMTKLVDRFEGKRFNAPNDLVIMTNGRAYFTDPHYVGKEALELDHQSVYRFDTDDKLYRATTNITKPNGVILSPDQKTLYVAETDNGKTGVEPADAPAKPARYTLNAFPIQADGTLGPKRVLADFGKEAGIDGMSMDKAGRIYAALRIPSHAGIAVINPAGKEVGFIPIETPPTNCAFGVADEAKVLYITAGSGLYRIKLNAIGFHPEIP